MNYTTINALDTSRPPTYFADGTKEEIETAKFAELPSPRDNWIQEGPS
jgi:hypothetical protein